MTECNSIINDIIDKLKMPKIIANYKRKLIYRKYRTKKGIKKRYLLIYNPFIEEIIDIYGLKYRALSYILKYEKNKD